MTQDLFKSTMESFPCLVMGTAGIAVIQLTDMRDVTTIAVGVVTVVCLLYNTFWLRRKRQGRE